MAEEETKVGFTPGPVIAAIIVIGIAITMCSRNNEALENAKQQEASEDAEVQKVLEEADNAIREAEQAEATPPSNWSYSLSIDEITGKESASASIVSDNYKRLSWPYDGETRLTIFVRKHPRYGNDVIFRVDQGQILCSSYDGCSGMINVDGKAEKLSLNEPADHDSEVVFARYDDAIIRKLKGSKRVVVELPMYQNGNVAWTFSTEGLEWPPKE